MCSDSHRMHRETALWGRKLLGPFATLRQGGRGSSLSCISSDGSKGGGRAIKQKQHGSLPSLPYGSDDMIYLMSAPKRADT